jgi:hypothetical protein
MGNEGFERKGEKRWGGEERARERPGALTYYYWSYWRLNAWKCHLHRNEEGWGGERERTGEIYHWQCPLHQILGESACTDC